MNNDLVKKTQFEKDVPFHVLEDIIKQLRLAEREHPEWPVDLNNAILGGNLGFTVQEELNAEHEQGFSAIARNRAINIAVTAIRYLKKYHSK